MSADVSAALSCSGCRVGRKVICIRWVALAALLILEVLAIEARFDTAVLLTEQRWWAGIVGESHLMVHAGIAVLAAVILTAGANVRHAHLRFSEELYRPYRSWVLFGACHLIASGVFAGLTFQILEGDVRSSVTPGAWVLAWFAVGFTSTICWALALLPARLWSSLLRFLALPIAAGIAVGGLACTAGYLLATSLWRPLAYWTFWCVEALLTTSMPDFFARPADLVVGTSRFAVQIAPACSGYEGIGLIAVFLACYLWWNRHTLRFPRALLLLPAGILLIWFANTIRIALLVVVGTYVSPAVAMGGFHSQAGWLAFNAVALGLAGVAARSQFFVTDRTGRLVASGANPAAPYLIPFLAIVTTTMVTAAVSSPGHLQWFYPVRVLVAGTALWYFRNVYRTLHWSCSWYAVATGVAVSMLWVILASRDASAQTPARPAVNLEIASIGWAAAWWLFRTAGYVIVVPLAEELAFRGFLTRRLIAADFQSVPVGQFSWFSLVGSSMLFGVMHGGHLCPAVIAGALFAVVLYRRRRICDAVCAHVTANGLLAAYAATTGNWYLWS